MKTVWKFKLDTTDTTVRMPEGAKVCTAALQGDDLCVWAEVDPKAPKEDRHFSVYCTGEEADGEYVATFFQGPFVFHVYET